MRHMSERRRLRAAEAEPVREALRQRGRCEVCCLTGRLPEQLAVHEIARSALRQKALDQRYAVLVVCRGPDFIRQTDCHRAVQDEPEARQLARLLVCRPEDYNLPAYLKLTRPGAPRRITEAEVTAELVRILTDQPKYGKLGLRRAFS